MRHANSAKVMKIDDKLVGVDLGADFCAEHEWGIKGLKRSFAIDGDKIGIEGRMITNVPKTLLYQDITVEKMKCHILVLCSDYYFDDLPNAKIKKSDIGNWNLYTYYLKDKGIDTSWDEHSFAIIVTDQYKDELKKMYDAFLNLDIAVGVAPSHAFHNGGLTFCIKSMLPKETIEEIKEDDLDYIKLQKAADKTKIKKTLEKAGKTYYALSPRWKDDDKKEVIFWLNPCEQDRNNYGWYTVQDLKDWSKNKGKIPKSPVD